MIGMVDLAINNLASVAQAFRRVGVEVSAIDTPEGVAAADVLVLPGVGAFGDAAASLRRLGLVDPIRRHVLERGRPLLGICLGMQLLADESHEHGRHAGLGLVPGSVRRLTAQPGLRVPNIGWSPVTVTRPEPPLANLGAAPAFYFAHSFQLVCDDPGDVRAWLDYGGPVAAVVQRGAAIGVQFHPEKSQDAGLTVLADFCASALAEARAA